MSSFGQFLLRSVKEMALAGGMLSCYVSIPCPTACKTVGSRHLKGVGKIESGCSEIKTFLPQTGRRREQESWGLSPRNVDLQLLVAPGQVAQDQRLPPCRAVPFPAPRPGPAAAAPPPWEAAPAPEVVGPQH